MTSQTTPGCRPRRPKRGERRIHRSRARTGANEIPGLVYLVHGAEALPREVPLDTPDNGVRITRFTSTKSSRTLLALDATAGGDLNGDAENDLVLGAGASRSDVEEYESGPGRVYIIFGGTQLAGLLDVEEVGDALPGTIVEGSLEGELLGFAVEFAPELGVDPTADGLGCEAGR